VEGFTVDGQTPTVVPRSYETPTPPRITRGPQAQGYSRVLRGEVSSERGTPVVLDKVFGVARKRTPRSANRGFGTRSNPDLSGRGDTRAEDAEGTPAQSHISPITLLCEV